MKCIETVDVHSNITFSALLPSVLCTFGTLMLSWVKKWPRLFRRTSCGTHSLRDCGRLGHPILAGWAWHMRYTRTTSRRNASRSNWRCSQDRVLQYNSHPFWITRSNVYANNGHHDFFVRMVMRYADSLICSVNATHSVVINFDHRWLVYSAGVFLDSIEMCNQPAQFQHCWRQGSQPCYHAMPQPRHHDIWWLIQCIFHWTLRSLLQRMAFLQWAVFQSILPNSANST